MEYQTVSPGVAQPVIAPTGVFTQFGGLEIETSSTQLQALTDAFLYLVTYPFECSEQIGSRVMSIAALIFVPIVLAYSAWSYYIFRKRISTKNMPAATNAPVSATSGY